MRLSVGQAPNGMTSITSRGCSMFGRLLAIVLVGVAASSTRTPAQAQTADARADAGASSKVAREPVILLTGYEPFGKHRPPNSSWQGIKDLDGRLWTGYRLVAREMPVVWGAPLEYLPRWIDEYKPVAIFSFGMGMPGAFAIETVGTNYRARYPDNNGKKPSSRRIVAGAPDVFHASAQESRRMAELLTRKGQTVRISTHAGHYLCEEALYSLEYLKKSRHLDTRVQFCHVPPLGTKIRGVVVTRNYVERFVLDTLESWAEMNRSSRPRRPVILASAIRPSREAADPAAVQAPRGQNAAAKDDDPRLADVRAFVEHYFRSWSDQDMDAYDACFLPESFVQYIDDRGTITITDKRRFVASQREVHRRSPERNIEVPESVEVRMEGRLAHAVVFWKLTSGARVQKGYDHFTLMRREGKWRIVNLVFYATAVEE